MLPFSPDAVFFDLDGTLADTADDLAAPIHAMRAARGLPQLPGEALRRVALGSQPQKQGVPKPWREVPWRVRRWP